MRNFIASIIVGAAVLFNPIQASAWSVLRIGGVYDYVYPGFRVVVLTAFSDAYGKGWIVVQFIGDNQVYRGNFAIWPADGLGREWAGWTEVNQPVFLSSSPNQ